MNPYKGVSIFDLPRVRTECVINGVRRDYDACTSKPLTDAVIKWHTDHGFEYFGSGRECYYNGVQTIWDTDHHFFNRKQP